MNKPLVSVIMAVHNTGPYLKESIESILSQSYTNIEFIIINNGSTDDSTKTISNYSDKRIRLINNTSNTNWLQAVNLALKEAKGEYIARMDHDDISLKDRLSKQVDFLSHHPEIGMCGTWMRTFDKGKNEIFKYPITPEECKVHLLFNICMLHPSIVFRKDLVEKFGIHYKQEFFPADDMELLAVNSNNIKYANLPEVLYKYRVHNEQASNTMAEIHNKLKFDVQLISLRKILPAITNDEIALYEKISFNRYEYNTEFLKKCETLLQKMIEKNFELKVFVPSALEEKLQQVWFDICTNLSSHNINTAKAYKTSPLHKASRFNRAHAKFFLKNILTCNKQ